MRAIRPGAAPGGQTAPWLLLGGGAAVLGLGWLVWFSGRLAAVLSGHGWDTGPGFGSTFAGELVRGHTEILWPGVPGALVAVIAGVLLLATVAVVVLGWRLVADRLPMPGDPHSSLARPADVASLTPAGVLASTRRLRPEFADTPVKSIAAANTGLLLGRLARHKVNLRACWEDVLLIFMGPRTGKTTSLAVPIVLDAPGPVVATSNRADLLLATAALRAERHHSTVWVFDPQQVAFTDRTWWWNPLDGVTTVEDAERLASHFVLTVDDPSKRDIWGPGASELLSALLLAAAVGGRSMQDVYRWLTDDVPEPVHILETRPEFAAVAQGLRKTQNLAWETKTGIYGTASIGARCLRNPEIMAWVTPSKRQLRKFDPHSFVTSTADTLYLLSKDSGGSAAPLVAALTDRVIRVATRYAETCGGRLPVPIPLVLDEAGNICKIADLPAQYSHLGGRGIVPVTILQNYAQGVSVWGPTGMKALWSAATVKMIGAGTDDDQFSETVSRLIGEHDVAVASVSRGRGGEVTESVSVRRQRILTPADIRELPKFHSLVLATGCKPAMVQLLPWQLGPHSGRVSSDVHKATIALQQRATAALAEI